MRHVGEINISNIRMDRYPLNPSTLNLVRHLETGGSVPPIHVQLCDDGGFAILDGRHRVTAFKLLGRKKIVARYGTRE